jgi:uncharacterized protein with HEPN domain
MSKTDADLIADIEKFALLAEHIVSKGIDTFMADSIESEILRQAAVRNVECVYIALNELSTEYSAEKEELGFDELRGMRNRIAHLYDDINPDFLWRALTEDLPNVVAVLGSK